ncbi:MAG: hypothetical protein LBE82_06645 [Chitinophagaceae bacterium]|jgi:hypothetical protein|nr:hypothetical protein [Chitinophagaceae bacterium]
MKKRTILTLSIVALVLGFSCQSFAQRYSSNSRSHSGGGSDYDNGVGLFVDFGNGGTFVGPHLKHYYNANNALQGMILFGNGRTLIGAEYSYNQPIPNAYGLKWNLGIGPQLAFGGGADVLLRPMVGLEYKVTATPVAFGLDWRPMWTLTHGSGFEAARFGLALKFTF